MLAVKYHGPKNLEYVDIPKSEVLPGTALLSLPEDNLYKDPSPVAYLPDTMP